MNDNGGRRSGSERRQSLMELDFQDRRSGAERRNKFDRRSGIDRRNPEGFRRIAGMDRRSTFIGI